MLENNPLECIDCGGGPIEAEGRCGTCRARMRREEAQARKDALKKPTSVRKVSSQRAAKLVLFGPKKKRYLQAHPLCELMIRGICAGMATEIHHCSMSDLDFLNEDTWKGGCAPCHRYVETELSAEERKKLGFLL